MTPEQEKQLQQARDDAELRHGDLLRAINASWLARTSELTETAVVGQPLVTDALDDRQLADLKRDLRDAVALGTERIPELFAKLLDIDTILNAHAGRSGHVDVVLRGSYPNSPPEKLVMEFYNILDRAGYNMEALKTGVPGKDYSSDSFTSDDINISAPAERAAFAEALTAILKLRAAIGAQEEAEAATRSQSRWNDA